MSFDPGRLDLCCQDNEDFSSPGGWGLFDVNGDPVDLTGVTLAMQVRSAANAGPALLNWSGQGDVTGLFTPTFTKGALQALTNGDQVVRRYAWDLTLTAGGVTTVYARGAFTIEPGVTR